MSSRLALLLILSWTTSATAAPRKIAFADLEKLVRERNENVQAAASTLKAQTERTGSLTRSFLPRLSADVGGEQFKAGSAAMESQSYWKIEAQMNLYRGGRDGIEETIRDSNVKIAKTQLDARSTKS